MSSAPGDLLADSWFAVTSEARVEGVVDREWLPTRRAPVRRVQRP